MSSVTARQERKAAWIWTLFIIGLFGINMVVAAIAISVAVGDPSFRPMPGYGEQAVDFQTRKVQQSDSDRLGWDATIIREPNGQGLKVVILDREKNAVTGCEGTVQAYHFTRVDVSQKVDLVESADSPGTYLAPMDISKNGNWHIEVLLQRAADRFVLDRDVAWTE